MPDPRKATQRITLANATQLKTGDELRAAAAIRQAVWRKRHWMIYNEVLKAVANVEQSSIILDKIENPRAAKAIREAVEKIRLEL